MLTYDMLKTNARKFVSLTSLTPEEVVTYFETGLGPSWVRTGTQPEEVQEK